MRSLYVENRQSCSCFGQILVPSCVKLQDAMLRVCVGNDSTTCSFSLISAELTDMPRFSTINLELFKLQPVLLFESQLFVLG